MRAQASITGLIGYLKSHDDIVMERCILGPRKSPVKQEWTGLHFADEKSKAREIKQLVKAPQLFNVDARCWEYIQHLN